MSENLSEKISIIIQAIDDTKGAVSKAVKDMTGLGEASRTASKGVDQAEKSLKGTVAATKEMWQACERADKSITKTGKSLGEAAKNADKATKEFDKTKKRSHRTCRRRIRCRAGRWCADHRVHHSWLAHHRSVHL